MLDLKYISRFKTEYVTGKGMFFKKNGAVKYN